MSLPVVPPHHADTPTEPFVYFAYGSTLDTEALRAWCAEHGYRPPDPSTAKPAVLDGWRLAFNVRSRFWGGAVASLVREADAHVEGIAWSLPGAGREFVRHKEGVLSGLYRELPVRVRSGGQEVAAIAFVAADDRVLASDEQPSPKFLEALIRGASEHGLSPAWIETLKKASPP